MPIFRPNNIIVFHTRRCNNGICKGERKSINPVLVKLAAKYLPVTISKIYLSIYIQGLAQLTLILLRNSTLKKFRLDYSWDIMWALSLYVKATGK